MTRRLYTLLLHLLLPVLLLRLFWRSRRQPAYRQRIGERFGCYPPPPEQPLIWLHAVSVGETRAAAPLIRRLRERYPNHRILLTQTTPTGRETAEQLFGEDVLRAYLPYDFPWAVSHFLRHFRPKMGLLMETEIWPNLIHSCHQAKIPLLLVNARLSEKSARRYARFSHLARTSLTELTAIAAQTKADAQRLAALGAPLPTITGNLKFDVAPPPAARETGVALRQRFGTSRPVWLAASTREGEESLLLDHVLPRIDAANALLILVPRHPQRFDEAAALLKKHGVSFQRRSAEEAIAPTTQVVLGDSMGELFAYYAACDVAYIGGSLLPFGGQNLIEAASMGTPILIGPHTYNFGEIAQHAIAAGAAIRVENPAALARQITELLGAAEKRQVMAQAGLRFAQAHQGATGRLLALLEPYLK